MRLNEFLPQDQWQAKKEHVCIADCIYGTQTMIDAGGYKSARISLEHALRSVKELERLQERKRLNDEVVALAIQLRKEGVEICIGR